MGSNVNGELKKQEEHFLTSFPNPFSSEITIQIQSDEKPEKIVLKVTDIYGQVVIQNAVLISAVKNGTELKVMRENICAGLYFFTVTDGKKTETMKVVAK